VFLCVVCVCLVRVCDVYMCGCWLWCLCMFACGICVIMCRGVLGFFACVVFMCFCDVHECE